MAVVAAMVTTVCWRTASPVGGGRLAGPRRGSTRRLVGSNGGVRRAARGARQPWRAVRWCMGCRVGAVLVDELADTWSAPSLAACSAASRFSFCTSRSSYSILSSSQALPVQSYMKNVVDQRVRLGRSDGSECWHSTGVGEGRALQTFSRGANLPRSSWPPGRRLPGDPGASAGGCRSCSQSPSGSPRGTVRTPPVTSVGVVGEGARQGVSEERACRGGRLGGFGGGTALRRVRKHSDRSAEVRTTPDLRRDLLIVGHDGPRGRVARWCSWERSKVQRWDCLYNKFPPDEMGRGLNLNFRRGLECLGSASSWSGQRGRAGTIRNH